VDGRASKAGPDLFAVGEEFGRRDLVDTVLMPSATISPGYGLTIIETKTGDAFQDILEIACYYRIGSRRTATERRPFAGSALEW
jgi:hypothetical protein